MAGQRIDIHRTLLHGDAWVIGCGIHVESRAGDGHAQCLGHHVKGLALVRYHLEKRLAAQQPHVAVVAGDVHGNGRVAVELHHTAVTEGDVEGFTGAGAVIGLPAQQQAGRQGHHQARRNSGGEPTPGATRAGGRARHRCGRLRPVCRGSWRHLPSQLPHAFGLAVGLGVGLVGAIPVGQLRTQVRVQRRLLHTHQPVQGLVAAGVGAILGGHDGSISAGKKRRAGSHGFALLCKRRTGVGFFQKRASLISHHPAPGNPCNGAAHHAPADAPVPSTPPARRPPVAR